MQGIYKYSYKKFKFLNFKGNIPKKYCILSLLLTKYMYCSIKIIYLNKENNAYLYYNISGIRDLSDWSQKRRD